MNYDTYINTTIVEMELRGYSPRTITSYTNYLKHFLSTTNKSVENIVEEDIKLYLHSLVARKLSTSYVNSVYSAAKFFFTVVLKKPLYLENIPRTKNSKKLPQVLSTKEVESIIDVTTNIKHKAILMTSYSAGLRVSEVLSLKVTDIDSDSMQIFIRSGKGNKDRYSVLSEKTLIFLRHYFKIYKPSHWLFYSQTNKDKQLSSRTAQRVFKDSLLKANIIKPVTLHSLRHSFATHLLLNGTNLFTIKTLLGHKSIQTTMVYLHLAPGTVFNVQSPYDMVNNDAK